MPIALGRSWCLSAVCLLALGTSNVLAQLPQQPAAGSRSLSRWAVVIGVNAHEDPAIPRNQRAVSDANAVERRLIDTMRWRPDHILSLMDGGNRLHGRPDEPVRRLAPTRENLDWAIKQWLNSRVKPGDFVLIYYAGHAVSLAPRAEEPPGARYRDYLIPSDARAVDFDTTGWSLDTALDGLANRGGNPIVCWLDTSTAGRGKGLTLRNRQPRGARRMLESLTRWPGVSAWISGGDEPLAEDETSGKTGPFLTAIFEALGTQNEPNTLLGCLDTLRNNEGLVKTGFTALGGIAPDWTLWGDQFSKQIRPNGELVVQAGHADRVRGLVLSADGRWMATSSMDSTVKSWSINEGTLLRTLSGFSEGVRSLAISGDGKRLAAGDGAGRVRFWSRLLTTPLARSGPSPHDGPVEFVAFLPDNRSVLSLDLDAGLPLLWDSAAPEAMPRKLLDVPVIVAATAAKRSTIVMALADADGIVHLLRPEGTEVRTLQREKSRVTSLAFSPDARQITVGDESGQVTRFDASTGQPTRASIKMGAAVDWIRYSGDGRFFFRAGRQVGTSNQRDFGSLPSEAGTLALSQNGRMLAFADDNLNGRVHLYSTEAKELVELPLNQAEASTSPPTSVAFSPDGSMLLVGGADGGLRSWSLPNRDPQFTIRANRRRVEHLAVAPDGKSLLQISAPDGVATLWNLDQAKLRPIAGSWSTGAFLGLDRLILAESTESGGRLRLIRTVDGTAVPGEFEQPRSAAGDGVANTVFDKLAVGPGATWVVAGSKAGQAPLLVAWEIATGKILFTSREQGLSLHSLSLSKDGKRLAATVDTQAIVYEIAADAKDLKRVRSINLEALDPGNTDPELLASAWLNDDSQRVALGSQGGRVFLWDTTREKAGRALPGALAGAVNTLACSPDGAFLGAAGDDRSIRVWPMGEERPQPLIFDVVPSHQERVTSLIAWPGGATFVSGSDDTQTRFWSLKNRSLLGSLSLVTPRQKPSTDDLETLEWVCTTPSGLFDASHNGADHVRWTIGEEVRSLEQIADKGYYVPKLTSFLARGEAAARPPVLADEPPSLSLEWSKPRAPTEQDAEITIALGEPGQPDIRLYQDGIPIASREDFKPTTDPRRWTFPVKLRGGENRFYALAGRPNRVDGRSTTLATLFTGPDSPSRLHILAIGISQYQRKALQYADDDARAMADFLHQRGLDVGGRPGVRAVLTDHDVDPIAIDRQFRRIREAVKNRPQDTVVVFLAGHTDVFEKKFCLLLPKYPFKADEPLLVASRAGDGKAAENPDAILPYGAIYTQLARLGALQRLVIVDACQAEAIKSDPQVELIKRYMASDSRKAKTSYILAARAGEAANEVSELKHGLLSYAVLRGLQADGIVTAVDPFRNTDVPITADLNGDGSISTREMERYVELALPVLTRRYSQLVQRGPNEPPLAPQEPVKLENDDANFPLLPARKVVSPPR